MASSIMRDPAAALATLAMYGCAGGMPTYSNLTVTGTLGQPSLPAVSASLTLASNSTYTGAPTVLRPTAAVDRASNYTAGTGVFCAPSAGVYMVNLGANIVAITSSASNSGAVQLIDGAGAVRSQMTVASNATTASRSSAASFLAVLNANDTLRLAASNVTVLPTPAPYLQIVKLNA